MAALITLDMFTTITKIDIISSILVLECRTGVGSPQTGVPPMSISGAGIGSSSVFSGQPVTNGEATIIQPKGLKLTKTTGQVFLFCNLAAIRALQNSKKIKLLITTPPGQTLPPVSTNYYWLVGSSGAPAFTPTVQPLFPVPGPSFGFWITAIWRDTIGQVGSGTELVAAASTGAATGGPKYGIVEGGLQVQINPKGVIDPTQNVFTQLAQYNANPLIWPHPPGSAFIVQGAFLTQPPDTTAWRLLAGVWKNKGDVVLPPNNGDIPALPPATPPTSFATAGGAPPSKTVTVTVSPAPANTVSLS